MELEKSIRAIRAGAERAIQLREAVPGMPQEGPYPATVNEVADELVTFIKELDATCARGVGEAVAERLLKSQDYSRAKTTLEPEWDGYRTYPTGTSVARAVGQLHTGWVADPTSADVDRCFSIHGVPGAREPMVLVRWARGDRSWEYIKDLRPIPGDRPGEQPGER